MLQSLRLLVFVLVGLYTLPACEKCSPKHRPNKVLRPGPPLALFILDDRSGSTDQIRKLTVGQYEQLVDMVADREQGGEISVCVVGNPVNQDADPYSVDFQSYQSKLPNARLDEGALANQRNHEIAALNEQCKTKFMDTVRLRILHYQPKDSQDITINLPACFQDLRNALTASRFKEQGFLCIVIILSDGFHENRKAERIALPPSAKLFQEEMPEVLWLTVGWEADKSCFEGLSVSERVSVEDMLRELDNELKKRDTPR